MKRKIIEQLIEWKNAKSRKPLVLNGARQVGKTFILNQYIQTHHPKVSYRFSQKNFGNADGIISLPLYAAFCL